MGTFGNRVSMMIVPIPTDEADPQAPAQAHARAAARRQGRATRRCPRTCSRTRRSFIPPAVASLARAHDDGGHGPHAPAAEPRDLQRARPAQRRCSSPAPSCEAQLPGVGRRRRRRAEHHVHELPRPPRLRDRRRPRPGRRRVDADGRGSRDALDELTRRCSARPPSAARDATSPSAGAKTRAYGRAAPRPRRFRRRHSASAGAARSGAARGAGASTARCSPGARRSVTSVAPTTAA